MHMGVRMVASSPKDPPCFTRVEWGPEVSKFFRPRASQHGGSLPACFLRSCWVPSAGRAALCEVWLLHVGQEADESLWLWDCPAVLPTSVT